MINEQTLRLLKEGDPKILKEIYEEHRDVFLNFAKRYDISSEDVVDIYQDAIIALRENAIQGKIKGKTSSLKTYLFGIGKFMILKKLKASKKMVVVENQDYFENKELDLFTFQENDVLSNRQKQLYEALSKISAQCIKVLTLFYSQGYTIEEIMIEEGYDNKNVVKSQKSRCLRSLRQLISLK